MWIKILYIGKYKLFFTCQALIKCFSGFALNTFLNVCVVCFTLHWNNHEPPLLVCNTLGYFSIASSFSDSHSETSATSRCSSDERWWILQYYMGPWKETGQPDIQGADKSKQTPVNGKKGTKKDLIPVHCCCCDANLCVFHAFRQELAKPFLRDKKYILLDRKKLSPYVNYTVDIQAKMSPENLYHGPWSEWSSAARWTTPAMSSEIEGRGALLRLTWI